MKRRCERALTPPGISFAAERRWFAAGLVLAALWSLRFVPGYLRALGALYETDRLTGERSLLEGAVMPPFAEVLGSALAGFPVLALAMVFVAVLHYQSHVRGSRSILLMRRLPDRWELHRRCLAAPLLGLLAAAAAALALWLLYFAVYRLATPQECLLPLSRPDPGRFLP